MRKIFIPLISLMLATPSWSITRQKFDFVVGRDGTWAQAKAAAEKSSVSRFRIFLPNGQYDFGSTTGDSNQMTKFAKANVSIIGQSMDGVVCYNKPTEEGIGVTATLCTSKNGMYMQDFTLQNRGTLPNGSFAARFVAYQDNQGDKNILVNIKMLSGQDTYYSTKGARRTYLEGCEIHGTVDFICGGGDIFFKKCSIYLENRNNNVIAAPNGTGEWGYVFSDCTIDGEGINEGQYRLGRSWNNKASAVYINTTMKKKPSAAGWGDPMNVVPTRFAEYNSRDIWGNAIDLSQRRSYYELTKDGNYTNTQINPVLSAQDAARFTIQNVCGQTDGWAPDKMAAQIPARQLSSNGNVLTWNHNDNALCYFIFANGNYVDHTTDNSYTIDNVDTRVLYTVRAANEMGGLGPESNAVTLQEEKVSENEHIFYYDNGQTAMRAGTEQYNQWMCTEQGFEDYGWEIISRDDKSILYGNDITFRGKTYKTFKSSNGAQNRITMPKGVKATKVTFIGYTNDAETSSVLSEINGESASLMMEAKVNSNSPSKVTYDFADAPCEKFTFTFGTKQACFIIALESEQCGCERPYVPVDTIPTDTIPTDTIPTDTVPAAIRVINVDFDAPQRIYNLQGQPVKAMKRGEIYIIDRKKVMYK